jgi:hypothetical protein
MAAVLTHSGSRKSVRFGVKRPVAVAVPDPLPDGDAPDTEPPSTPAPSKPPVQQPLVFGPSVDAFATPEFDISLAFDWFAPDATTDLELFNPIELDDFEFRAPSPFDDWLTNA